MKKEKRVLSPRGRRPYLRLYVCMDFCTTLAHDVSLYLARTMGDKVRSIDRHACTIPPQTIGHDTTNHTAGDERIQTDDFNSDYSLHNPKLDLFLPHANHTAVYPRTSYGHSHTAGAGGGRRPFHPGSTRLPHGQPAAEEGGGEGGRQDVPQRRQARPGAQGIALQPRWVCCLLKLLASSRPHNQ